MSNLVKNTSMTHTRKMPDLTQNILLKVVSKDLNAGAEEDHKQDPYRDRQKLEKSLVLTQGLQQENECSMQLALRVRSFRTRAMSSSSERLDWRIWPRCLTEFESWRWRLLKKKLVERDSGVRENRISWVLSALNIRLWEVAKDEQVLSIKRRTEGEGASRSDIICVTNSTKKVLVPVTTNTLSLKLEQKVININKQ